MTTLEDFPQVAPRASSSSMVTPAVVSLPSSPTGKLKPHENSNPSKSNQSSTENKTARVDRIRNFAVGLLVATEAILVMLIAVMLAMYQKYLFAAAEREAKVQMSVMMDQYLNTPETAQFTLQELAFSSEITSLLQDSTIDSPHYEPALGLLKLQSSLQYLEYVTLLRANCSILASVNNNRTNEFWDPSGIVSLSIAEEQPVVGNILIPVAEWKAEGALQVPDGEYATRSALGIFDTGSVGLGQYAAVPVYDSNDTLLGALVSIYLMNGKTDLEELVVGAFGGGFGSVCIWNGTSWVTASQLRYLSTDNVDYSSEGIDLTSILNEARSSQSEVFKQVTAPDGTSYVLAALSMPKYMIGGVDGTALKNTSDVVLVRGYSLEDLNSNYATVAFEAFCFMAVCIIFDIIGLIVSLRFFVDPLQELIMHVTNHAYDKYSKTIARISLVKRLSIRVAFFAGLSVGFLIWLAVVNTNDLRQTFTELLSSKLAQTAVSYQIEQFMYEMNAANLLYAQDPTVLNFVGASNRSLYLPIVTQQLRREEQLVKLDYATIVDSNRIIIACSNNNRIGEIFDPSGVSTYVLENNVPFVGMTSMNSSEFLKEGSPLHNSSFSFGGLLRQYYPHANSTTPVIVQFTAAPIFLNGSTVASGVLIYGSILNGADLDSGSLTSGVVAIAARNSSTGIYSAVTIQFIDGSTEDAGVSFWIGSAKSLMEKARDAREVQEGFTTYNDVKYSVAVWPVDSSYWQDWSYNLNPIPQYLTEFHPEFYTIRASSVDLWNDLVTSQEALMISVVFIQAISMAASTWVLYNPVRKFLLYIDGSIKKDSNKTKASRSSEAETASPKQSEIALKPVVPSFQAPERSENV